jgi:hypothetical protein
MFQEIKASLRQLYSEDKRPWLVGPLLISARRAMWNRDRD